MVCIFRNICIFRNMVAGLDIPAVHWWLLIFDALVLVLGHTATLKMRLQTRWVRVWESTGNQECKTWNVRNKWKNIKAVWSDFLLLLLMQILLPSWGQPWRTNQMCNSPFNKIECKKPCVQEKSAPCLSSVLYFLKTVRIFRIFGLKAYDIFMLYGLPCVDGGVSELWT